MGIETLIAMLVSLGSVAGLGWWLRGEFRKVEKGQGAILDAHEAKDQERHEENLERFTQLKIGLARLGYRNGGVP
mgnify:CR=1 FL=1